MDPISKHIHTDVDLQTVADGCPLKGLWFPGCLPIFIYLFLILFWFIHNFMNFWCDVQVFYSPQSFVCLWIMITSFSVQGTWVSRTASSPQGCGTWQNWSECHRVSNNRHNTFRLSNKDKKQCVQYLFPDGGSIKEPIACLLNIFTTKTQYKSMTCMFNLFIFLNASSCSHSVRS